MVSREELDVLKKVAQIGALAGISGKIDQENGVFSAGMQMGNRGQLVHVRPCNRNFQGAQVVTFFSPCIRVEKGFMKGITKEMAIELLRLNEEALFARYGIWTGQNADLIVASVDHLLDTLDPEEFESSFVHVAIAADQYESRYGRDEF
ncbi:MAG: hypothetical protein PVH19_02050 [Planctomycetia bacterium]|jgi:hypothetical protein